MQPLIVSAQIDIGSLLEEIPSGKNAIINGAMDVWQRGTSFPFITHGFFAADHWADDTVGSADFTIIRSTDVPTTLQAGTRFTHSMSLELVDSEDPIPVGERSGFSQSIEGFRWRALAETPFIISFWIKAVTGSGSGVVTGTYCLALTNGNLNEAVVDRSYIAEFTINAVNTWEKKVIIVPAAPTTGAWFYNNSNGLKFRMVLGAGTDFITPAPNIWQTGFFLRTSGMPNRAGPDFDNSIIKITGVQFEPGNVATLFEQRSYGEELFLCQRYYEQSYNDDIAPGTITINGRELDYVSVLTSAVHDMNGTVKFKVPKRFEPTSIHTYSTVTGAIDQIRDASNSSDRPAIFDPASRNGFFVNTTQLAATTNKNFQFHWTAEAEYD